MTAPAIETPAQRVMRKYMGILNQVNSLGPMGFADVLDTANPGELAELERAADVVQRELARRAAR